MKRLNTKAQIAREGIKRPESPPPPPPRADTPIEPGGGGSTYALSPVTPNLPYLGKTISKDIPPLSRVLVTVGNYKNNTFFLVFSATKYTPPPFPRKWERACGPLMHSSGGPGELPGPLSGPRPYITDFGVRALVRPLPEMKILDPPLYTV